MEDHNTYKIHPLYLNFSNPLIEKLFIKEIIYESFKSFRVVLIIAFLIHSIYFVKDMVWTMDDSVWMRGLGILPFLLFVYLLSGVESLRDNNNLYQLLVSIAVFVIVVLQTSLALISNHATYTQISHALPVIMYATFLFSGISFRTLIIYVGPLTYMIPILLMWSILPYPFWHKIDVTIILIINLAIAIFAKYYLELYHRQKFCEIDNQKNQKKILADINNELQLQKELYKGLTLRSEDLVSIIDLEGKIQFLSPSINNLLGYNSNELLRSLAINILHHEDKDVWKDISEQLLAGKKIERDMRLVHKNGSVVWVNTIAVPIFNSKKALISIQSDSRNIDMKKEVESNLIESVERLETLNNQKLKFFSVISHDLRGPFNHVVSLAPLLEKSIETENKEEAISIITMLKMSSNNASLLLNNLLTWSKTQLDGTVVIKSNVNLKEVVTVNIDLLESLSSKKGIALSNLIEEDTVIYADKDMFDIVFRNVISNAIKFTNNGGEINVFTREKTNDKIVVVIEDNGIGIPKERIDTLFQIDNNKSTLGTNNEEGTGLGLVICKEFIELNNGKLWIESKVGKGTSVIFTIPSLS